MEQGSTGGIKQLAAACADPPWLGELTAGLANTPDYIRSANIHNNKHLYLVLLGKSACRAGKNAVVSIVAAEKRLKLMKVWDAIRAGAGVWDPGSHAFLKVLEIWAKPV